MEAELKCKNCKHYHESGLSTLADGTPDYNDDYDYCMIDLVDDYDCDDEVFECEGFELKKELGALR